MAGAFSWTEVYNMSIQMRQFYMTQMMEYAQKEQEAMKKNDQNPNSKMVIPAMARNPRPRYK